MKKGKELILKTIGIELEDMPVVRLASFKEVVSTKKLIQVIVKDGVNKLRRNELHYAKVLSELLKEN